MYYDIVRNEKRKVYMNTLTALTGIAAIVLLVYYVIILMRGDK